MGGKLGLVQFYEYAWVSRTNGTGADSLQGAAISRLQAFPLGGRCLRAHTGADEGAMIERSRSSQGISPPAGGEFLCPRRQRNQNAAGDGSG